jgi:hypothetical protein
MYNRLSEYPRIVTPDIIKFRTVDDKRRVAFDVIKAINSGLETNEIRSDNSITVNFSYSLEIALLEQLKDVYEVKGWKKVDYRLIINLNMEKGSTSITFYA